MLMRRLSIYCALISSHFLIVTYHNLIHAEAVWDTGWIRSENNPVLSLSPSGAFDSHNIFAPAITKHNGLYYLYYSGGPDGPLTGEPYDNYQLGLATSTDGINFQKQGAPLLPLGVQDNFHAVPALLRDVSGNLLLDSDGTWHMIYNGSRADDVRHATSLDGIHWQKDSHGIIFKNAYAPNLLKVGDEYRMYYVHKPPSGAPWEIRLATGPDLYHLEPLGASILTNSQEWETSSLFYPYVFQDNGTWVMFYGAYWGTDVRNTAIGTATSVDGIHWTKNANNPIFTPTPGSAYDSVYTSSQSVIRDGDVYRMYYAGRIDGIHKYYSIAMATKIVPEPNSVALTVGGIIGIAVYAQAFGRTRKCNLHRCR